MALQSAWNELTKPYLNNLSLQILWHSPHNLGDARSISSQTNWLQPKDPWQLIVCLAKWGYPKMDGLWWKILLKSMICLFLEKPISCIKKTLEKSVLALNASTRKSSSSRGLEPRIFIALHGGGGPGVVFNWYTVDGSEIPIPNHRGK